MHTSGRPRTNVICFKTSRSCLSGALALSLSRSSSWMESKRLRIQVYTRAARRDGLLHAVGPRASVNEKM